jgi:hypothetical protein
VDAMNRSLILAQMFATVFENDCFETESIIFVRSGGEASSLKLKASPSNQLGSLTLKINNQQRDEFRTV